MPYHDDLTSLHQLYDADLEYADESTLLAATPSSDLYHRYGYAIAERTYWLWTQDGWSLSQNPQLGSGAVLSAAVVYEGNVVTYEDEIVWD